MVSMSSTLTIRGRIPLTSTVFSVKFVFEKSENKQKRGRVGAVKEASIQVTTFEALPTVHN